MVFQVNIGRMQLAFKRQCKCPTETMCTQMKTKMEVENSGNTVSYRPSALFINYEIFV